MRTTPLAPLLSLLLLTACTSSSPPKAPAGPVLPAESSFAAGTCAAAAPDVIAVGKALPRLGAGGVVDPGVKDELRTAQDRLFALAETAEPTIKPAFDDLVLKIGIVRIRADGNTYETAEGALLQKAYDAAVDVCTGPSPAG